MPEVDLIKGPDIGGDTPSSGNDIAPSEKPEEEKVDPVIGLINEILGNDPGIHTKEEIQTTIENIMDQYHLNTKYDFVRKIATMKLPKGESITIDDFPSELQDAAFLPVNTIADIALKHDIDLIVSQVPEWYNALIVTRDAVCEADVASGKLAKDITFDKTNLAEPVEENIRAKIEAVEERLELDEIIRNHVVFNTLMYGEGSIYCIPYAKVFEDCYNYKVKNAKAQKNNSVVNMFGTSSVLNGYGYGESSTLETTLGEAILEHENPTVASKAKPHTEQALFTEAEMMELIPGYHAKPAADAPKDVVKTMKEHDEAVDAFLENVKHNIRFINNPIALPVIEESLHDLQCVYDVKYKDNAAESVGKVKTFFEQVMQEDGKGKYDDMDEDFDRRFGNVSGIYLRILPATKLIPIRVDRTIIGYYYISDGTRPEETGERKNSGLTGYTLRTPSVGYDTFSPDQMFCEKIATKIINNFDLKFMRDNTALHEQIVAVLMAHRFNDSLMRFIFIPADNVITGAINKDGSGKGHSMLEAGLVTARMYMFLKLYSILYQINNSQIRVYNLRSSGLDKNYQQFTQQVMRKFAQRRVTANDIFNYRGSMTKVSGYSEMVMPMGAGNQSPIEISNIDAAQTPINTDLLDEMRRETLNSTPVPSIMVQNGGVTEVEFAKETELANTRFESFVCGVKLDLNKPCTMLYRKILRWETDIDPQIIATLKFKFQIPTKKYAILTSEKLNNLQATIDFVINNFLSPSERKEGDGEMGDSTVAREAKKLLIADWAPELNVEHIEEIINKAREQANKVKLDKTNAEENIVDDADQMGGV